MALPDRQAVEILLRQAGLPMSDDEIDEFATTYELLRAPVEALYAPQVEKLLT